MKKKHQDAVTVNRLLDITGTVQGIGFRPAIYRLALQSGLNGWIQNRSGTVRMSLAGPPETINRFLDTLPDQLPPGAHINTMRVISEEQIPPPPLPAVFEIISSEKDAQSGILIPPDMAICRECMREIFSPQNRRYGYPFTTCTRCGPRYTVVEHMPYDRENTTMRVFPLCPECRHEYDEVADRRFHAESIACLVCGPQLTLLDNNGEEICGDPLQTARAALAEGRIVALRGMGGFLLAVDAQNKSAINRLRQRKKRPHQALALMVADIETAARLCPLTVAEKAMLSSSAAPIVIPEAMPANNNPLPVDVIAPDTGTLGLMLPTTPLQALLFEPLKNDPVPAFKYLIMTSGNRHGDPLCQTNSDAVNHLRDIADIFITHNREIALRTDDSVCVMHGNTPQIWRRSRGFAPRAIPLTHTIETAVLAMGADLKNCIALAEGHNAYLSAHIGDLASVESIRQMENLITQMPEFLKFTPGAIAVDMHPDMISTRIGMETAKKLGIPLIRVQHHHAHAAAVLAEHGYESGLALIFDGTGMGTDGTIWGAELLYVNPTGFTRLAGFAPIPLPGGDAAVKHPRRQAVIRLHYAGVLNKAWLDMLDVSENNAATWIQQAEQQLNSPPTHAAGRLFDAVSALLGCAPATTTYEGQAPIRLEKYARAAHELSKTSAAKDLFTTNRQNKLLLIDWKPLFQSLNDPSYVRQNVNLIAGLFHSAVAEAGYTMLQHGIKQYPALPVALTGGVFMNRILTRKMRQMFSNTQTEILIPQQIPPNDGCIALGQAVIAGRGQIT